MIRRLLFLVPVLVFAGLAAYLGVGLTRDPKLLPSALLDKPAPDFTLPGLGSKPGLGKADFAGKVTLVNFFASWCVPCRVEHPMLMRLSEEGKVNLVGVAYKDKPDDSTKFLTQLGDPYQRIGVDLTGRVGIDFGVYGVPETYVVDKEGRVRYRQVGPLSAEDWEKIVAPLIKSLERT